MTKNTPLPWPYPRLFAHRLGGALAPENTLAGLALSHALGVAAVECDVKLSADGIPYLLHDDTLTRTTNGQGMAAAYDWAALSQLDAGSWFHPAFRDERLPTLAALAEAARRYAMAVNLEIKPCPGSEQDTGRIVAQQAATLWAGDPLPPLLSSFSLPALQAASRAAPELVRALLLEGWPDDWLEQARHCRAHALHVDYRQLNAERVADAKRAGLALMAWTVNDGATAARLWGWGVEMLCSDRPERLPA